MSKSCRLDEASNGNVYKWLDFLREGGASVEKSSCQTLKRVYAAHFPDKGVTDVVKVSGMRSLTAFTVCLWMSSSATEGTPFSYAVPGRGNENELLIYYNRYFRLYIDGKKSQTSITAHDGEWHHICVSWQSSSGAWKFYKDGHMQEQGTNLERGHTIRQGGTLVLGQEQDSVGGDFDATQSFQGMLTEVNVWNRVLTPDQIKGMSTSCSLDEASDGNVYNWMDFLRQGGPRLVTPSPCQPFGRLDYAFDFPDKGVVDHIKMPGMPSLTSVTVCLWMSSSATAGAPFSYAVSGQENDNELLIYYNRYFYLHIGGTKREISVTVNDGVWHHICVSWENSLGSWKFYKDGDLEAEDSDLKKDYTITEGGVLVLGQEQDSVGDDFDSTQSFQGMLSHVNVWNRVLPGGQIKMSKSCLLDAGNVFTWSDFLRAGGAKLVQQSPCKTAEVVPGTKSVSDAGDWTLWNGYYYSYRGKSAANSWFSAEGVCRQSGDIVHLTSIHSQQENDFINSLSSGEEEQWIGLTDHNIRSSSFKWIDGSAYGDFTTAWATGEPNQATIDEDCGAMKPDGTWMDVACRKQRLDSDTPFDRRAFTCKTSGTTVTSGTSPSLQKKVKEVHDPAISVVDISSAGSSTKVTFFTGLHYIAPNGKFAATANKVKYGALLKFARYVDMTTKQLGPLDSQRRRDVTHAHGRPGAINDQDNDVSGVADLDGVVDKIEIPHYTDMSAMGSAASLGFSIEFWIRPRRMPVDATPMALFFKSSRSSGSISLNLKVDGSIVFSATPHSGTPVTCTTDIVTVETHKVRPLAFQHIAVTGTVGSSLVIKVNGATACQKTSWGGITALPASNEGTLVFGENDVDSRQLKRFNGQISNIQLFNTQRTQQQIATSIQGPNPTAAGSIGFWSMRQSDEINLVHYVISDSGGVSNLEVLEEYDPPLTGFPVEAVVRNQNMYIFRFTEEGHVVAKKLALSANKKTISIPGPENKRIIESSQAKKGCLAATLDQSRGRLFLMECFAEDRSPGSVRFKWNIFQINAQGEISAATQAAARGSLLVAGIGSLDTRLSAKIVNNHLLLTAGTTSSASIFFLDLTLDSNGLPSISVSQFTAQSIGPEIADSGATYYAYLHKQSTTSSKPFLRRIRPQNGHVSSSYVIDVRDTDPSRLVANTISSNMPDNDWFWFLFKISTFNGGIAIQSGERINIQTPDSNPQNNKKWNYVKSNCETLQADKNREVLNFWIFKTESCDPENGGYSVVSGEISPNDCILLWPKTEQFEPGYYHHILAHPTERAIKSAKARFGSWFGPWRLMISTEASPVRPLPIPADSPPNSPRNVYQGNKYSLLHFGRGISVGTASQQSVRGGLLQFAKTTLTPIIVSNNQSPASVKLIFRGNGGSFPHAAFPHDEKAKLEVLFSTVYQEGSYSQRTMTSGLFYGIAYIPPSDSSSQGEFKNLARIGGLENLEYPDPPTSFVWLIPPPFKVTGMCAAISTIFKFNDDTVDNIAPNSVASLTDVVDNAVGPGSFGEGIFKPFLSVHFDVTLLTKIGERVHASLMRKINEHIPQPPPASPTNRPPSGTHSWQELGDLEACVSLANLTFWEDKVRKQRIKDKLTQALQSKWMTEEIYKIRQEVAPDYLSDVSAKYSAYGGVAVLIANRLRSQEFLEELLTNDQSFVQPILDSHLKVVDLIRPDLGIGVRQDIMSALLAKEIIQQPWAIMQSLDKEKQKDAISAAIMSIYDGNVAPEVRAEFVDVMNGIMNIILFPMTTTQLGVFNNFLDMKKLDVLRAVDARGKDFWDNFLGLFVVEHQANVLELNEATPHHMEVFRERPQDLDGWAVEWQKFTNKPNMNIKQENLRNLFKVKHPDPLTELSRDILPTVIRNNPRLIAGTTHAFNLLGAVGATISIFREITNPDSDLRARDPRAIASVVATAIGGAGAIKGTYDLAKVLGQKVLKVYRSAETPKFYGFRESEELAENFEIGLATELSVDITNLERYSSRLARMSKAAKLGRVFTALGVVADGIFFGIGIYDLYQDFTQDSLDPWKIADDFAFAASAGVGAALGVATLFGVAGAAAAATGVGALIVIGIGLIAWISETIRGKVRADQERERQCNKWKEWCNWGKGLFDHYGFLENSDPCSECPSQKKHNILRIMYSNRRFFSPALKRAWINGLDSGKDVKSLVPSLGKIEKKTCPAWLRHVFKGQGKKNVVKSYTGSRRKINTSKKTSMDKENSI